LANAESAAANEKTRLLLQEQECQLVAKNEETIAEVTKYQEKERQNEMVIARLRKERDAATAAKSKLAYKLQKKENPKGEKPRGGNGD
jgi:hypothetical protein